MSRIYSELSRIQKELKAPKGQYNSFGGYKFRSCEDILEAVKPHLGECCLYAADSMVEVGGRVYVKSTATICLPDGESISVSAFAREQNTKKGMDESQITGAASSYARKYAFSGLLCIDDTKDADTEEQANANESKIARRIEEQVADKLAKKKLGQGAFEKAIERLQNGEYDVYKKTTDAFDCTDDQINAMLDILPQSEIDKA